MCSSPARPFSHSQAYLLTRQMGWGIEADKRRTGGKCQTLSPKASVLHLMGSVCWNERGSETPGTSGQRLEEVGGGGGGKWAWALCGRAAPLSVSIAGGVRVTLHLGPSCSVGSVASAIVMVMGASHRGALQ